MKLNLTSVTSSLKSTLNMKLLGTSLGIWAGGVAAGAMIITGAVYLNQDSETVHQTVVDVELTSNIDADPLADLAINFESDLENSALVAAVSITLTSQEIMWVDANKCGAEGPRGAWLSFDITNTSTAAETLTDVEVVFNGFTNQMDPGGAFVWADSPVDDTRQLGTLTPGQSKPVYFYVDYQLVCTNPQGGGSPYDDFTADYTMDVTSNEASTSRSSTITTDELLTASAAGLLQSTSIGPGIFVGQIVTQTTVYSFGNNTDLFFQPAGEADFPEECYRLIGSEVTATSGGVSVTTGVDRLHFPSASVPGGGGTITLQYQWEVLCIEPAFTINPWAAAKSGQKYKYSGFSDVVDQDIPMGSQAITISKSATPLSFCAAQDDAGLGAGIVQYTITLTNPEDVDIYVDSITDVLPQYFYVLDPMMPVVMSMPQIQTCYQREADLVSAMVAVQVLQPLNGSE